MLCSPRFADRAPAEVYATLLDEGTYLCSERTMYRILAGKEAVRERRAQRSHPNHPKPEVVARAPNQAWSWDITRLLGPEKWQYFYLYVILDIYSRYAAGWMVAERETAGLAGHLIGETCLKHRVQPRVLTLHSDRGAPMTAKCTAQLLADLGVTQSLGRPRVSNDNPYSEAQFKPVKYHPGFPGRFADIEEAKDFCREFFHWYNTEHPPRRHRPAHAPAGPPRPRPRGDRAQTEGAGRGLRRPARPLRRWPAEGHEAPGGGLDQPRTPRHVGQRRRTRRHRGKGGLTKLNRQVSHNRWQVPNLLDRHTDHRRQGQGLGSCASRFDAVPILPFSSLRRSSL